MEQRISLVTLGVADLARARRFYEAMGWTGAHQPDDEVCFFQTGGMVFGLWTALGGHGAPGIELAYNVRSPEEVAAVLEEARRAGGTVERPAAPADGGPLIALRIPVADQQADAQGVLEPDARKLPRGGEHQEFVANLERSAKPAVGAAITCHEHMFGPRPDGCAPSAAVIGQ